MATIAISADTLTVSITGLDRILALKSHLDVPLEHIVSVDAGAEAVARIRGGWNVLKTIRLPGTSIPGLVTAGSYYHFGDGDYAGWSFWDVHDPEKALVIQLADEHYRCLVVGVDDPAAAAAQISRALASR